MNVIAQLVMESEWLAHVFDGFPRIMLFLSKSDTMPVDRIPEVTTQNNYLTLIRKHFDNFSCYVSVYPQVGLFNKIYIDLDDEQDIQKAYTEMQAIVSYFRKKYQYTPRVYFTGKKGFAIYIDFQYVKLTHMEYTVREYVRRLQQELNLTTIDWAAIGQDNRVSRIPYTRNISTGWYCIPISPDWKLNAILESSKNPNFRDIPALNIIQCFDFPQVLYEIDERIPSKIIYKPREIHFKENMMERLRIVNSIIRNAPNVKDHRHRILFLLLVPHLVWAGFDVESTKSICEEWLNNTPEDGRKDIYHYLNYVESVYKRTVEGKWDAFPLRKFIGLYPETGLYFLTKENN